MSSIKRQIESGTTSVHTAKVVTAIITIVAIGSLLLGISLGGWLL